MSKIKDALEKAKRMRGMTAPFVLIDDGVAANNAAGPQRTHTAIVDYNKNAVVQHNVITLTADPYRMSERFKLFKTQILTKTQLTGDRTILITSCGDGEGKTFTAINLAVIFAREVDQTVLLVDVNLKHPSVLPAFGIDATEGLTDYLLHNKPLAEILICPGVEKLTILPAGESIEHSSEMLGSLKMQRLIAEMKGRYHDRYIFFDGPSIMTSVDTMVLSKYIDRTLLVVEAGKVSPAQLSESINLLSEDKILGTVLNKGKPT
jgi:protein-tyrosine kinase